MGRVVLVLYISLGTLVISVKDICVCVDHGASAPGHHGFWVYNCTVLPLLDVVLENKINPIHSFRQQ